MAYHDRCFFLVDVWLWSVLWLVSTGHASSALCHGNSVQSGSVLFNVCVSTDGITCWEHSTSRLALNKEYTGRLFFWQNLYQSALSRAYKRGIFSVQILLNQTIHSCQSTLNKVCIHFFSTVYPVEFCGWMTIIIFFCHKRAHLEINFFFQNMYCCVSSRGHYVEIYPSLLLLGIINVHCCLNSNCYNTITVLHVSFYHLCCPQWVCNIIHNCHLNE